MTVTQVRYPLAPPVEGRKGTLLDAATISPENFTWQDGIALFDSYNCLSFGTDANFCAANSKTLSATVGWQDGFRFAAYGGITCKAIGLDQDTMKAQVQRAFDLGESTAVEAALMKRRFIANADIAYSSVPAMGAPSTAVTGGTLAAGTYMAVLTAITAAGETTASNEVSIATTGVASTVTFSWGNLTNETGYRLYVTAVNGASGSETFLIALAADVTTYTWTGTPARSAGAPPTTNTAQLPDALPGTWTAPTDITPAAGAVAPRVGLAMLEGHAARNYVGTPTLHLPVSVASLIAGVDGLTYEGNVLYTKYGSKVAAGAGYDYPNTGPTGAVAPVGEKWLYATGSVWVATGEPNIRQAMNTDNNEVVVLAERGYIVAVDCYTSAIRVTVTA